MKKAKAVIEESDLFAKEITLTYEADPEVSSTTSVVISIALIFLFGYVFIDRFVVMVNRTNINSQLLSFQESTPSAMSINSSNFMFAVGVQ